MLTLDVVEYFPGSLKKIQVCKSFWKLYSELLTLEFRNIDEVSKHFVQKSERKPGSNSAEKQK